MKDIRVICFRLSASMHSHLLRSASCSLPAAIRRDGLLMWKCMPIRSGMAEVMPRLSAEKPCLLPRACRPARYWHSLSRLFSCRCLCISDKAWIQRFRSLLPLPGDSAGSGQLSAILCRLPEFPAPSQYHAAGIAGTLRTTRFSYSGTRCRSCTVFYSGEAGRSKAWGDSFITRSF